MAEITIKIEKRGDLPGSIGWLAKNAATISIGQTKIEGEPGAWLKDHAGKTIDTLVLVLGDFGECFLVNRDETNTDELARNYPYTDAAWVVMEQLIKIAAEQLREPEEMADAYTVTVAPKDPLMAAMMQAASDDPAVRPALIDYVQNAD